MWYNAIMRTLLRSPLHSLLSGNTMLITVRGSKSGKAYATPVNYVGDDPYLLSVSFKTRTWWRNLRGGAPVAVLLAGRERAGRAEVAEDDVAVAAGLARLLQAAPGYARYLGIRLDANGRPHPADLAHAAQDRVFIRTQLDL